MRHAAKIGFHWPCLGLLLLQLFASSASARVFEVEATDDSSNENAGVTLRAAIIKANRIGGENLIVLGEEQNEGRQNRKTRRPKPAGWKFYLNLAGADEDAARTGDLDIRRGSLTIRGVGSNVVIDASALGDRVFQVFSNATLTLENLTITGGSAVGKSYSIFPEGEPGGAIYNLGQLTLRNCRIVGNASGNGGYFFEKPHPFTGNGGDGGAIFNLGKLSVFGCVFSNNITGSGNDGRNIIFDGRIFTVGSGGNGGNGGGIFNGGAVWLSDTKIVENQCGRGGFGNDDFNKLRFAGGDGGHGGGIFNIGFLSVSNCVIGDNQAGDGGAGGSSYVVAGVGGAGGDGGGIFNSGKLTMAVSHVFQNSCGDGGAGGTGNATSRYFGNGGDGGNGGSGGGLYSADKADSTWINSVIELNTAGLGGAGGFGITEESKGADGADGYGPDIGEN